MFTKLVMAIIALLSGSNKSFSIDLKKVTDDVTDFTKKFNGLINYYSKVIQITFSLKGSNLTLNCPKAVAVALIAKVLLTSRVINKVGGETTLKNFYKTVRISEVCTIADFNNQFSEKSSKIHKCDGCKATADYHFTIEGRKHHLCRKCLK